MSFEVENSDPTYTKRIVVFLNLLNKYSDKDDNLPFEKYAKNKR